MNQDREFCESVRSLGQQRGEVTPYILDIDESQSRLRDQVKTCCLHHAPSGDPEFY